MVLWHRLNKRELLKDGRLVMPKIMVEIEWDNPNDFNWLNVFSIHSCLARECPNTHWLD